MACVVVSSPPDVVALVPDDVIVVAVVAAFNPEDVTPDAADEETPAPEAWAEAVRLCFARF